MLKKISSLLAVFVLFAWLNPAVAAKPNYAPEIPENNGTYDVLGHPDLKVKVYVHKSKPAKPAPAPSPVPDPVISCSNSQSRFIVNPTGWHLPESYTYNLNPNSVPAYVSGLSTVSSNAFKAWTDAIPNKVAITPGANTNITKAVYDEKNIIAWGRASKSALAVTYIWYDSTTQKVKELDTIMNNSYFWASGCFANAYDAQEILTHELGHWFGLDDHYTPAYADNTMYGYGAKAETKKSTLTDGDIVGLQNIYYNL